jgi:hypothetical protein
MNEQNVSSFLIPTQEVIKLKWFTFRQNNSGGKFIINDNVDVFVIIQAHNATEANELAQRVGIYFNGVDDGYDCECCGDRWSTMWDDDKGTDEPEIYGERVPWPKLLGCYLTFRKTLLPDGVKVYPYHIISKI